MRFVRQFDRQLDVEETAERVWAWHSRAGAFDRLAPPWRDLRVVERNTELSDGACLTFEMALGPVSMRWQAEHRAVRPGRGFVDFQLRGPFFAWLHEHGFENLGPGNSRLVDRVRYRLPLEPISGLLASRRLADDLDAMFAWRHHTLRHDLALHRNLRQRFGERRRRVAVRGWNDRVGPTLVAMLSTGGHEVVGWAPKGEARCAVAVPWTRIEPLDRAPEVWSRRFHAVVDFTQHRLSVARSQNPGTGRTHSIRRIDLRWGLVLTPRSGVLAEWLSGLPFRRLARPAIDGAVSWISADDAAAAIVHAIHDPSIEGTLDLVSPRVTSWSELAATLGAVCRRAPARRRVLGWRGDPDLEPATADSTPDDLLKAGFRHRHPELAEALRCLLGRSRGAVT